MNERIKQITGQVLDELVPETWVALGYDKIKEIQNRTAELIVQECMACSIWVGKMNTNSVEPIHTAHAINQRIKEHFGVEQ